MITDVGSSAYDLGRTIVAWGEHEGGGCDGTRYFIGTPGDRVERWGGEVGWRWDGTVKNRKRVGKARKVVEKSRMLRGSRELPVWAGLRRTCGSVYKQLIDPTDND